VQVAQLWPRLLGIALEDVALQDAFVGTCDGFHVFVRPDRGGALGVSMWRGAGPAADTFVSADRIVAAKATEE
jgi:hypothetical protein